MKRLEPVFQKIEKYGEAFLQYFHRLLLDKDELKEINEKIGWFLNVSPSDHETMSKEEERKLVSVTKLLKYVQHLEIQGKIDSTPFYITLDFMKNVRVLQVVNCGKVSDVSNGGGIETCILENSTVPLSRLRSIQRVHFIRTPPRRIDFNAIPRDSVIDFAFKNGKLDNPNTILRNPWKNCNIWSFRSNRVENLSSLPSSLPNCVELDLSYNRIENISSLNQMKVLEVLDLSMNKVRLSDEQMFIPSLIELNVSHNMLSSVKGLLRCENLRRLNVSFNQLSSFDEIYNLTKLRKLIDLTIKGNRICKENQQSYPKIVRKYFEFHDSFSLDGVLYSEMTKESEYELMLQEIQRREKEQAEWKKKSRKKKNKNAKPPPPSEIPTTPTTSFHASFSNSPRGSPRESFEIMKDY